MVTVSGFAQQVPQYSQYLKNPFMVNPGAAGIYDFTDITMSGRWQWVGFENSPKTAYLSGSTVIGQPKARYNPGFRVSQGIVRNPEINTGKLKHALGGQLLFDEYGAFRRMNAAATYAIHIPMSKNYNLSFGTRLGMSNNQFLPDRAVVLNPTDPYQNYGGGDTEYDGYIGNQSSRWIMDLGVGLYFYSKNLFVGISADHLSKDLVNFGTGTANFNTQMHYNFTAGYKIPVGQKFTITPAVLIKNMQPAPFSIEATVMAEYEEWMFFGASYRHKDAVVGMFGINISSKFRLGYSYDFSITKMNQASSGGHELIMGIMLR